MYLDGLSFLEDERDAWRPYETLDELTDAELSTPVDGAHGWSGRDLIGHLVFWQEVYLTLARDLAVGESSPNYDRLYAEWTAEGDALNDRKQAEWAALPLDEVRRRFREIPGELRGYLTVVPETRWVKNPAILDHFLGGTIRHYDEHLGDLRAILASAGR